MANDPVNTPQSALGGISNDPALYRKLMFKSSSFFYFQRLKDTWLKDPCFKTYDIDGSDCSIIIYLSEVRCRCFLKLSQVKPAIEWNLIDKILEHAAGCS